MNRLLEHHTNWSNRATIDPRHKIYALLSMLHNDYSELATLPDFPIPQQVLMRAVVAYLCFCEIHCVPELRYDTIDDFLSTIDLIDNDILEKIMETSRSIDLESLLKYGSHYIRIDNFLVEAASRNQCMGEGMVKLLLDAMNQEERPPSPAFSQATSVFSEESTPSTNTSYSPEDVELSGM